MKGLLTADRGGGTECLSDLGIELDIEILLRGNGLIPLLASHVHPLLELLTDEGIYEVAEVAPRHLAYLPYDWQGVGYF